MSTQVVERAETAEAFAQRVVADPDLWAAYLLGFEYGRASGWLAGYDYRNDVTWTAAVAVIDNVVTDRARKWEVAQ